MMLLMMFLTHNVLKSVAALHEHFDGSVLKLVEAGQGNAQRLLEIVVREFSSYRDERIFRGRRGMSSHALPSTEWMPTHRACTLLALSNA